MEIELQEYLGLRPEARVGIPPVLVPNSGIPDVLLGTQEQSATQRTKARLRGPSSAFGHASRSSIKIHK